MQRLCTILLLSVPGVSACSSSRTPVQAQSDEEVREQFLSLFDMEVQNRAYGLISAERALKRASTEGDKIFLGTWLDWERFLKDRYAPYATKYGLSQEPRSKAKIEAGLGLFAAGVLSDRSMMEFMLNETIKYTEKLEELEKVSPEEDRAFFQFVVTQERTQIEALRIRAEGRHQEAADVLREFMAASSADSNHNGSEMKGSDN